MRRESLRPPCRGFTHSRYSPACTTTVSPAWAMPAARLIVRKGRSAEPSAVSDPLVATWNTTVMRGQAFPWLSLAEAGLSLAEAGGEAAEELAPADHVHHHDGDRG